MEKILIRLLIWFWLACTIHISIMTMYDIQSTIQNIEVSMNLTTLSSLGWSIWFIYLKKYI